MQILNGRRHGVLSLAFSQRGRWLAAGGNGGLHLWDTTKPMERARPVVLNRVVQRVYNLAFRPDGRLFCSSWDSWFLVDPETAKATRLTNQRFGGYDISPDGTRAVRVHQFSPLRTYRIGDEKVIAGPTVSVARTYFGGAAFTPDGTTFVVVEMVYPSRVPARRLTLRAADSAKCTATLSPAFDNDSHFRFSSDGSRLVSWSQASLACWAVDEPESPPRRSVNPSRKHFLSMAFHPGGKLLTVDNDRLVRVWDTGTLTADRAIGWNVGKLYAVAVSPDGTRAAVGSHTGKVLVWDWD